MSKKIMAMILGLVMILSLCPATVFGALPATTMALTMDAENGPNPSSGSVTGTITQYGKNVDDFEHLTPSATTFNVYPDASKNQTSNVFVPASTQNTQHDFAVIEATGKDGNTSKMLKMDATYDEARLYVWKLPLPAGQITRFAFDIYFETFDNSRADTNTYDVCFNGLISNGVTYGRLKSFIKEKTWYRYVVEIDANQKSRTAFLDTDGNIVYCQATRASSSGSGYTNGWAVTEGASNTWINTYKEPTVEISSNNKSVMYIDNAEISAYQASAFAPSLVSSSLANNAKNVSTATKEVTVTFDQPLTAAKATLTPAGGSAVDCTATFVSGVGKKEHTYIITLPALAAETEYTLALNGFSNKSLGCADTIAFKTEDAGIIVDRETFEADTNPDVTGSRNKYASRSAVLKKDGYYGLKTELVTGYEAGTQALKLSYGETQDYPTHLMTTKSYGLPVYDGDGVSKKGSLVVSYRIKVEARGSNALIQLGGLSDNTAPAKLIPSGSALQIGNAWDAAISYRSVLENHWYNVVWVMDEDGYKFSFIDAEGADKGAVVYQRNKAWGDTGVNSDVGNGSKVTFYPAYMHHLDNKSNKINISTAIVVDDFAVWSILPDLESQKLVLTSSDSGAVLDKDDENNNSITMTFNQPVMADSAMFELYKDTSKNELAYSTANVRWTDFCTQEVSFSNLQYMTDYTLDYSRVKAASGAGLGADTAEATLSFSTEADPNAMSITGDISCTGLNINDKVSFNLYSKEASQATVIVGFYERSYADTLTGVERMEVSAVNGITPVQLTLTKEHTADYIKFYVWNGLNTLVPLSRVYEIPASGTIDVLMIGNSLTQDTGYYMHDMAVAGGLDLNLTVKGLGGSTLTDHADNLRAELAGRTAEKALEQWEAGEIKYPFYFTYVNGELRNGSAETLLLTHALKEKQYDIISLQQFDTYPDSDFEALPYLVAEIRKLQPNAEIVLYQKWVPRLGSREERNYEFISALEPTAKKWAEYVGKNVENISLNGGPMKMVTAGKAFYLADNLYDWCGTLPTAKDESDTSTGDAAIISDMDRSAGLLRDAGHASYYGCYLADAVWYGTLTGKKAPVGTEANPVVKAPNGITAAEHIERLNSLSDIAYQVVLEQKN